MPGRGAGEARQRRAADTGGPRAALPLRAPGPAHRLSPAAPAGDDPDEYGFLAGALADAATLRRAGALARRWNVTPLAVMLSQGWVRPDDYVHALARSCGARPLDERDQASLVPPAAASPRQILRAAVLRGRQGYAVDATSSRPADIRRALAQISGSQRPSLATGRALRHAIAHRLRHSLTSHAVHGLARRNRDECAAGGLARTQTFALAAIATMLLLGFACWPLPTLRILATVATLFFALVVALRVIACADLLFAAPLRWASARAPAAIAEGDLPVYTLLVPLFREAQMLPALARALARLDYPAAKLDIKLIFESIDAETIAAAKALELPANIEFIVVPQGGPRTKPKALNYALPFARGEYVGIYDAEDRPEPDQLRRALAAFRAGPANLGCVQARLNFYNATENWLTKQFAIEYAALFDGVLPALDRLTLPIPLGGTSCHFRLAALFWLRAWDAFNVTEDADLGMRLARRGFVCRVLASTTQEEATCRLKPWLHQRTRWLKGWMQTYAVHMRRPVRLWHELGPARFIGFQTVIGGMVLSALVHPLFYLLVIAEAASEALFALPGSLLGLPFWTLGIANVAIGYAASMTLGLAALRRRGLSLAPQVLLMPFYWLLISFAAYRALVQLLYAPYRWEKTEHGLTNLADAAARERALKRSRRLALS